MKILRLNYKYQNKLSNTYKTSKLFQTITNVNFIIYILVSKNHFYRLILLYTECYINESM